MMVGRRSFRSTCVHFQGWSLGKLHELPNLSFLKRIFSAQTKIQKKKHPFCWVIVVTPFFFAMKVYIYIGEASDWTHDGYFWKLRTFNSTSLSKNADYLEQNRRDLKKLGLRILRHPLMAALKITSKPWNRSEGELYKGIFCRKNFPPVSWKTVIIAQGNAHLVAQLYSKHDKLG